LQLFIWYKKMVLKRAALKMIGDSGKIYAIDFGAIYGPKVRTPMFFRLQILHAINLAASMKVKIGRLASCMSPTTVNYT
jgi:hypothetical protein